ncbi:MAG: FtsK/SpoIIIE domain-containing protein [Ilumatobacter sp.]
MTQTSLPPLELVGPDGQRLTVRSLDRDDTVASLAAQLGTIKLRTAHGPLDEDDRLVDIDALRIGTRLHREPPEAAAPRERPEVDEAGAESRRGDRPELAVAVATAPTTLIEVAVVEVAVLAGPSASGWMPLSPGRHLLGRAPHCRPALDDPTVERHHALVCISDTGDIEITQLSGSVPIRVDGTALDETRQVQFGARVMVGSSELRFRSAAGESVPVGSDAGLRAGGGSIASHVADPWRRVVWRAPFSSPTWSADTIVAPDPPREPSPPSFTGLIGVGVTAAGAVVIAQVMGNPMFMLFALMGVVASLTTFVVGMVVAQRQCRGARADHLALLAALRRNVASLGASRREHHREHHRSVTDTLLEALAGGGRIWQRRLDPASASGDVRPLQAVVGVGTFRWRPDIEVAHAEALDPSLIQQIEACSRLPDAAAPISLHPGDAVALHGPAPLGSAVARSIVCQLATWVGPADWQLVVVTRQQHAWQWADWLPHGALDTNSVIVVSADSALLGDALDSLNNDRRTLLVTDAGDLFTARTGALRRFVARAEAASVVIVDTDDTVPAMCRRVLTVGSTGSASWVGDTPEEDDAVAIQFAGLSIAAADEVARSLACLIDPEDDGGAGAGAPQAVAFGELISRGESTVDAIAERWRAGGTDPALCAPLGMSSDGRVDIDLVRDGPHGLIAGTTGSGKSELLRTLVLSLAASVGPQHLNFVLVDYKGGSTFDACMTLPHTVGLVTDLDDGLAERALVSLEAELHRRERMLRLVGASDLTDYRGRPGDPGKAVEPIARLVVVIDEFAALAQDLPDFLHSLVGIAQRGRSLGVHLLLATQRPAGVVNDDIRANTNLRLALRLHDRSDAVDVVGNELPAQFPRGVPGRAALRLGPDELVVFQAGRCTGAAPDQHSHGMLIEDTTTARTTDHRPLEADARTELDVTVEAIAEAAHREGVGAPHRPWVEPLAFPLASTAVEASLAGATDVDAGAGAIIGLVDDPEHQRRRPLTWSPADGSLGLIGSVGAGTTSTLISLAAGLCSDTSPDVLHLYVIDARGDGGLAALASLAHCGGVVRILEVERLHRLLRRLADLIDERLAGGRGDVGGGDDGDGDGEVVVMIDGYASVRTALSAPDRQPTFDLLQRVINEGAGANVVVVLADDATSAVTAASLSNRWLFHLDDPSAARGMGHRGPLVPAGKPGRLRVLATGLEAQVAQGAAGLASVPAHDDVDSGPEPVRVLPDVVCATSLVRCVSRSATAVPTGSTRLAIGIESDTLGLATLGVNAGDHVLIIGAPRTGVSTALARCVAAWEIDAAARSMAFDVIRVDRRTPLDASTISNAEVRVAVVVDDAHRIDDDGTLAAIARGDHAHVTLFAAGRADAIRTTYGHWAREVAKARCGIVMSSRGEPDGDLLGASIPRRPLITARPGLGWLIDGGPLRMAQIAV